MGFFSVFSCLQRQRLQTQCQSRSPVRMKLCSKSSRSTGSWWANRMLLPSPKSRGWMGNAALSMSLVAQALSWLLLRSVLRERSLAQERLLFVRAEFWVQGQPVTTACAMCSTGWPLMRLVDCAMTGAASDAEVVEEQIEQMIRTKKNIANIRISKINII